MQVFVPFPNIHDSLDILCKKRLTKQVIECGQILDVILQRKTSKGWVNHPAVKMWRNNPEALQLYKNQGFYLALSKFNIKWVKTKPEAIANINIIRRVSPFIDLPKMPDWWGRTDIHESHIANLVRKAYTDTMNNQYELYYNLLGKLGHDEFSRININLPYVWS